MKIRLVLALTLLATTTVMAPTASSIGPSCVPDQYGHVECGKQCRYDHICVSSQNGTPYPREYYCYVYDTAPTGCWHDGVYEECCAPKRTF